MKQIYSKTHTLVAPVSQALVAPKGANGKALEGTKIVQHPVGTVLKFDDVEADGLIDSGVAVEYKEDEAKATNGVVLVGVPQTMTTPQLAEGFTVPTVLRQDESLNETGTTTVMSGPVVLGDTRDAAAKQAELDKVAASNAAAVVVVPAK